MTEDETMHVRRPYFRYEVNLNTVILFVTLVSTGAGWGYTWNKVTTGQEANKAAIERLETRMTTMENTGRVLDNHELRISNVETSSRDASAALRAVESSLHTLSSDMRLTRDAVERLERSQNGRRVAD